MRRYLRALLADIRKSGLVLLGVILGLMLLARLPLVASVELVNESGQPMTNVKVSERSSLFRFGPTHRGRRVVDGSFMAACFSCGSLHLSLSKDRYMREVVNIYSSHGTYGTAELEVASWLFGMVQRVRVPMEAVGVTRLQRFEGRLEFHSLQHPTVLPLHKGLSRGPLNWVHARFSELEDVGELRYVGLDADLEPSGEIATIERARPGYKPDPPRNAAKPRLAEYPRRVVLDFSHAEGGVKLFASPPDLPRLFPEEQVLRRMRQAPQDGYAPSVVLDIDAVDTRSNAYYFYCITGGLYCKGVITMPYHSSTEQITANIRLWLNPDGSRELRAEYY